MCVTSKKKNKQNKKSHKIKTWNAVLIFRLFHHFISFIYFFLCLLMNLKIENSYYENDTYFWSLTNNYNTQTIHEQWPKRWKRRKWKKRVSWVNNYISTPKIFLLKTAQNSTQADTDTHRYMHILFTNLQWPKVNSKCLCIFFLFYPKITKMYIFI